MPTISEKTLIPIGVAVLVIGGGSFWLSSLYAKTNQLAEKISAIETIQKDLNDIKMDVAQIKYILRKKGD